MILIVSKTDSDGEGVHPLMNKARVRILKKGTAKKGPVLYWMSRGQRVRDNWTLLYSRKLALQRGVPLIVLFCFVPEFLDATLRHYDFMIFGLQAVEADLRKLKIPFRLLIGSPEVEILCE